jgi:hypothetical protein
MAKIAELVYGASAYSTSRWFEPGTLTLGHRYVCGAMIAMVRSDSLLERTGFEPRRPVDFAACHHGLNRSTAEDRLVSEQTSNLSHGHAFR